MSDRRTKEQWLEDRRSTAEARKLAAQFYNDVDAAISRRADYSPTRAAEFVAYETFRLILNKWGEGRAREIFAQFGPMPKRRLQHKRKLGLAGEYGRAGKPNAKTGKYSMAAFARAMAKQNEGRPKEARVGSGTTNGNNMLSDLKRMLKQKRYRDVVDHCYALRRNGAGTSFR